MSCGGVVINDDCVVDWHSDDVFVIDFHNLNGMLESGDYWDVLVHWATMPDDVFPASTHEDMLELACKAWKRIGYAEREAFSIQFSAQPMAIDCRVHD